SSETNLSSTSFKKKSLIFSRIASTASSIGEISISILVFINKENYYLTNIMIKRQRLCTPRTPFPHPCASSRFIPFVRSSLSSFTHFQHRTARVFLHSLPLLSSSFSHTLAFPNAHPNAGKAVFVSRSVLFRKNISARVKCTPFGRPCIYRSLTSSFALQ